MVVQNFPKLEELVVDNPTPIRTARPLWLTLAVLPGYGASRRWCRRSAVPDAVGARLVLAGSFSPPELEKELRRRTEWERVDFLGWHDAHQENLIGGRVGLVTLTQYQTI